MSLLFSLLDLVVGGRRADELVETPVLGHIINGGKTPMLLLYIHGEEVEVGPYRC